ncbi:MAG TPA: hypothetical protein VGY55_15020 [Pirellulales bacterium]|nr:hypothetical protein [Pirellulales bacterium]
MQLDVRHFRLAADCVETLSFENSVAVWRGLAWRLFAGLRFDVWLFRMARRGVEAIDFVDGIALRRRLAAQLVAHETQGVTVVVGLGKTCRLL